MSYENNVKIMLIETILSMGEDDVMEVEEVFEKKKWIVWKESKRR
jgi:hypothetical protein